MRGCLRSVPFPIEITGTVVVIFAVTSWDKYSAKIQRPLALQFKKVILLECP